MTPIGSTSSNIRRAIEFMVDPTFCNPGAPSGRSRSVGRPRTAKLIAQRSQIAAWGTARNVAVEAQQLLQARAAQRRLTRHVGRARVGDLLEASGHRTRS